LVLLIAAAVWLSMPAFAAQAQVPPPVRVATFNVYNYLQMDRRVEGRFRPNYPKPESEKAAIRAVIRAIQPDVLALQELGPAPYLEELRRDLIEEGYVLPYGEVLEAADPERHVAVLSRLPFARVTPHREVDFKYFGERELVKSGLLEVTFASPAGEWTLFVVHLKSRYTDRPDDPMSADRRVLEARAVRDEIVARFPNPAEARFVIAGDLNDTTASKPLQAMRRRGKLTISELVPARDSRGETWTHRYHPEDVYSRVDFLLVSPGLWPRVVGQTGHVHDGEGALLGSDHRLVYLELDLTAAVAAPGPVAPAPEPDSDAEEATPAPGGAVLSRPTGDADVD